MVGYSLYRSIDGINYVWIANISTGTEYYVDMGLTDGLEYYYNITAYDEVPNESPLSTSVSGIPADTIPPEPPTGLNATLGPSPAEVTLTWNASLEPDVAGYAIYRSYFAGGPYTLITTVGLVTTYTDGAFYEDATYYYIIKAFDEVPNYSNSSSIVNETVQDIFLPATPSGLAVYNPWTGYSLILNWNPNAESDLTSYVLFYSTDNVTFYWLFNVSADRISFIHYGVTTGIRYYYKIAAADEIPNQSPFSDVVHGTPDIDTDNDGIGNNADTDDDNDGIPDISDPYPLIPIYDIESLINITRTLNEIQNNISKIQLDLYKMNASLGDLEEEIDNLNQSFQIKIDNLERMLLNISGNLSHQNQSIANDILKITEELDKLRLDTNQKLENISNRLNEFVKLDDIINDLDTLNQSTKTMEDNLKNAIKDTSSEDDIGLIWILLVIVFILLVVNLLLTILIIKLQKFNGKEIRPQQMVEKNEEQETPPPPPSSL